MRCSKKYWGREWDFQHFLRWCHNPISKKKKISKGKMISVDIWIIKYWGGGVRILSQWSFDREKKKLCRCIWEPRWRVENSKSSVYKDTGEERDILIICGYDISEQMIFYKQSLECWHLVDLMKHVSFWRVKINGGQERIHHSTVWNSSTVWNTASLTPERMGIIKHHHMPGLRTSLHKRILWEHLLVKISALLPIKRKVVSVFKWTGKVLYDSATSLHGES